MENKLNIEEIVEELFGFSPTVLQQNYETEEINKGNNNRLFRINGPGNLVYAIKSYSINNNINVKGVDTEFKTLTFLSNSGLNNVPLPILTEKKYNCGVYKWIDGGPVKNIGFNEVDQAIMFIKKLHNLKNKTEAKDFELAKEACLSGDEIVNQIMSRYYKLMEQAAFNSKLSDFLRNKIGPLLIILINKAKSNYKSENMNFSIKLDKKFQTLSPSDFGFHNSIEKNTGEIHFIDFEYFGWDDPVKLVCDFVLHPGMKTIKSEKNVMKYFAENINEVYRVDSQYKKRVDFLFPLYGLRWILIILNEFIPKKWEKRKFAGECRDRNKVLEGQLGKASFYYDCLNKFMKSNKKEQNLNSFLTLFGKKSLSVN